MTYSNSCVLGREKNRSHFSNRYSNSLLSSSTIPKRKKSNKSVRILANSFSNDHLFIE